MSDKILPKRGFKSKTAVTSCGYCNLKIKEENLESHCRTVHKKPKLVAGQRTLQGLLLSRSSSHQELSNNNVGVFPPVVEPDPTQPPPSKKFKYSEDCDDFEEEEGSDPCARYHQTGPNKGMMWSILAISKLQSESTPTAPADDRPASHPAQCQP